MPATTITIRAAVPDDLALIMTFIRGLAEYERLGSEVVGTEEQLRGHLFGPRPYCEVIIAEDARGPAGFALFFHNYSTFLTRPGIYLEDLFVIPERRGEGFGKALLVRLAQIAVERGCGRMEWSVLNWNEPSINFYRALGAVMKDAWTTCRIDGERLETLAQRT